MTVDQYQELIDFLSGKFARIDARFEGIDGRLDGIDGRLNGLEGRLTKVEVSLEALRGDVQLLAEGLTTTNDRLDRYHRDHEIRIQALENRWFEA